MTNDEQHGSPTRKRGSERSEADENSSLALGVPR